MSTFLQTLRAFCPALEAASKKADETDDTDEWAEKMEEAADAGVMAMISEMPPSSWDVDGEPGIDMPEVAQVAVVGLYTFATYLAFSGIAEEPAVLQVQAAYAQHRARMDAGGFHYHLDDRTCDGCGDTQAVTVLDKHDRAWCLPCVRKGLPGSGDYS